jgi:hypothetical protein
MVGPTRLVDLEMKLLLRSYAFFFTRSGYQDLPDASGPTRDGDSIPSELWQSYTQGVVN